MARGTRKSTWKVAFDPLTGNHLSYDPGVVVMRGENGERITLDTLQLVPDVELTATLTFLRFHRGRSSIVAIFAGRETGLTAALASAGPPQSREFSMFLAEFERLVPHLREGVISGRWGFAKNGNNTGLVRLASW